MMISTLMLLFLLDWAPELAGVSQYILVIFPVISSNPFSIVNYSFIRVFL